MLRHNRFQNQIVRGTKECLKNMREFKEAATMFSPVMSFQDQQILLQTFESIAALSREIADEMKANLTR